MIEDIELQEEKDYQTTKEILTKIFKDKLLAIERIKGKNHVDCSFTGSTETQYKEYGMEIKESHETLYEKYGFLFKIAKYINMFNWKKDHQHHQLYIIYLVEKQRKYFIFDVEAIKLDINSMMNMRMKVTQFKENSEKCDTPCILLYPKDAVMYGTY